LNPKKQVDIEPEFEESALIDYKNLNIDLSRIIESRGILMHLLSDFLKTAKGFDNPQKLYAVSRLEDVLKYIDYNLDKNITLKDMAKQAHLNPTYFSNLFAKLMKQRPIQYLNRKRIEKAQLLLCHTHFKLKTIALQVGIQDPNYFSRLFKKYIGTSPGEYRKREKRHIIKRTVISENQ
jgi:YesN/AraC family two-component response regulator